MSQKVYFDVLIQVYVFVPCGGRVSQKRIEYVNDMGWVFVPCGGRVSQKRFTVLHICLKKA